MKSTCCSTPTTSIDRGRPIDGGRRRSVHTNPNLWRADSCGERGVKCHDMMKTTTTMTRKATRKGKAITTTSRGDNNTPAQAMTWSRERSRIDPVQPSSRQRVEGGPSVAPPPPSAQVYASEGKFFLRRSTFKVKSKQWVRRVAFLSGLEELGARFSSMEVIVIVVDGSCGCAKG